MDIEYVSTPVVNSEKTKRWNQAGRGGEKNEQKKKRETRLCQYLMLPDYYIYIYKFDESKSGIDQNLNLDLDLAQLKG